ncbi:MAG: hypothetical protein ABSG56_33325 [Bryobacteraceae bacterium]|jgi:hypothetical protein
MRLALQYGAWAIGLWLNLRVISALVRGSYREYPFVFAYALSLLASTVVEIALQAAPRRVQDGYYWIDEVILDVLVFCVVIAFIDEAARHSKQKTIERHWLVLAAALIFAVSYAIHHSSHFNLQMTLISRDLNICAAVLDLILWSLLVTARRPNRRLMLLSGGLGLQLTGAIMGEQLRQLSRSLFLTGTLLEVTTGLLGLYVWWRALRTQTARATSLA